MKTKICIVVANYYPKISKNLLKGAIKLLKDYNLKNHKVIFVPGIFEIPVLIAKNMSYYDAFIALGCVIKGQTPHFDFISQASTDALMRLSIENKKPIGVICIAPAMLACALRDMGLRAELTIGNDTEVAEKINQMGSTHIDCPVDDIVIDNELKIISTPAYMLATRISEAAEGINKLVNKIVELI